MSAGVARLADLVRLGMPDLVETFGHRLTAHQRNALQAIAHCRTGAFGATAMRCSGCGYLCQRLRSCGHRSCPQCQHHSASAWLERQQAKRLPVDYFMVTFTLPRSLRAIAYTAPKSVYPALFTAVAATLKAFNRNHPKLQAETGFSAVLHTHSRRLEYHPHLHVIIPGGGVDSRQRPERAWRTLEGRYLFNGFALAKVFRAKCLDTLRRAGVNLPGAVPKKWVVHCQYVGNGAGALAYLSRYLYRGVIAERDLLDYDAQRRTVTFRFRDAKTRRYAQRTLPIAEFLWHIALHVLPKGLQRVRHYGFLHGNAKGLLQRVQLALRHLIARPPPRDPKPFLCTRCGAPMRIGHFIPAPLPSG